MNQTALKKPKISARNVDVFYGEKHAIKDLSIEIPEKAVSAFIGPSGCGKSTFLRSINRMNDTIPTCKVTGKIEIDEKDIYDPETQPVPQIHLRECCLRPENPRTGSFENGHGYGC